MKPLTKKELRHWHKVAVQTHRLPLEVIQELSEGLSRGKFDSDQAQSALLILGEGNAQSTRPIVERYLTHDDPWLRYNALSALILDWGLEDHRATCIRMMHEDPDEDNRSMAATCLGSLDRATHNPETLRLLLQVFLNDSEDKYVRRRAYSAILNIVGVPRAQHPPSTKEWNWDTDINWKLLNDLQQKHGTPPSS